MLDETLQPREEVTNTISITSDYPVRKAQLYATVNEIMLDATGEIKEFVSPASSDRTNTITSWIEISRGRIEVLPGETVEVPITVKVNPQAVPGEYHAFIGIVEAPNRPTAQGKAMRGEADGVLLKVTIPDQRKDAMQVKSFEVERFLITEDSRDISITLLNNGDLPATPTGEIIFYDSNGREVAAVDVNQESATVQPGKEVVLEAEVPLENKLGRYKANLSLNYGRSQTAALFDTASFYMLSPLWLATLIGSILLVALLVAILIYRAISDARLPEDDSVAVYVRPGAPPAEPQDHDINLKGS